MSITKEDEIKMETLRLANLYIKKEISQEQAALEMANLIVRLAKDRKEEIQLKNYFVTLHQNHPAKYQILFCKFWKSVLRDLQSQQLSCNVTC